MAKLERDCAGLKPNMLTKEQFDRIAKKGSKQPKGQPVKKGK